MPNVLIIEDEMFIAYDLADIAERAGCDQVIIASTEEQAVACAAELKPDLILSDHTLRQGTGPGAIARIISLHGAIPAIYITATPELCTELPHCTVLAKPFSETVVHNAILSALNNQGRTAELSVG